MRKIEQSNIDEKLTFDDICIVPAPISDINHRKDCNVYIHDEKNPCSVGYKIATLPIFASPMGAVIDENTWEKFFNKGICPVIPRTVKYQKRLELMKKTFTSFSMNEADKIFVRNYDSLVKEVDATNPAYICIDLANGHMKSLLSLISTIKEAYGKSVIIMSGNIANPEAYKYYVESKCDYVRCSIGTGFCCTTSTLTATHYPPASLLQEICEIRDAYAHPEDCPKIIADGGITCYADCIKALACGADYAMIGRMFAQCVEACETMYEKLKDGSTFYSPEILKKIEHHLNTYEDFPDNLYRIYYGMSTRYAQKKIADARENPDDPFEYKNAEGNVEEIQVTNTLDRWVDIFISSVKSTMSYSNMYEITELPDTKKIRVSVNAFMSYKKHTSNK